MTHRKPISALVLSATGLALVGYAIQSAVATRSHGHAALLPFVVGLVVLCGAAFVPVAWTVRAAPWLFGASIALAGLRGALRYSSAGAEGVKVAVVLLLVWALGRQTEPRDARSAAGLAVMLLGGILPLVVAGELGTAAMVLLVSATMLAHESFTKPAKVLLGTLYVVGVPLAGALGLHGYQRARLLGFLENDPQGTSYQTVHAVRLVAAGGFLGHGSGAWVHAERHPLPQASDGFALAVWAYERGFVGVAVVGVLFAVLVATMLRASRSAVSAEGRRLALGGAALLLWQGTWNAAMVLGMAPILSVPMPFVSHGGASLFVSAMVVGLAAAALRERGGDGSQGSDRGSQGSDRR